MQMIESYTVKGATQKVNLLLFNRMKHCNAYIYS